MAELTVTEDELNALKSIFLPPEQAEKLKDLEIEEATLHARYRGVPLEAVLRVTPKG